MNTKIIKTVSGGIIGTTFMTIVMMLGPMIGIPKMSPPEMLSEMLGVSIFLAWVMHFMIGIAFAFAYTYHCLTMLNKLKNVWVKGAIFGIIAFIFAQIMLGLLGMIFPMPKMEDSMVLTAIGSLFGHIVFGMAISKTVGDTVQCNSNCKV